MALVHSLPIRNHSRHPQSMFIPRTNAHRVSSVYNGVRFTRIDRPQMGINFGGRSSSRSSLRRKVVINFQNGNGNGWFLSGKKYSWNFLDREGRKSKRRNLTELFNISNWALTVYETGVRIEENIPDNKTANKISAKNSNFCKSFEKRYSIIRNRAMLSNHTRAVSRIDSRQLLAAVSAEGHRRRKWRVDTELE